jgi:hypothetical protein
MALLFVGGIGLQMALLAKRVKELEAQLTEKGLKPGRD